MNTPFDFQDYRSKALAEGFDEVAVREWGADVVQPDHTHNFSVRALVVEGEMWLTCGGQTQHLRPGETFKLDSGTVHSERYGSEGATYWAARRNSV